MDREKQIRISAQILAGNLGDGWQDQNAAAKALADYTRSVWLDDCAEIGHEVVIDIDVQRNTSGAARHLSVDVSPYGDDSDDLALEVESALTDALVI
ncbi:MAG: hypothetical protein ACREVH_00075 [Gammaproteobacteria bacterium]